MVRLPCHCKVYLPSKCKCQLRQPGYRLLGVDNVVYTTQGFNHQILQYRTNADNPRRLYELKEESNTTLVDKAQVTPETFYGTCTENNLRYRPITGFLKNNRDYFKRMVKDVATLICYLVSNFVVFLTIVCKTFVHSLLLIILGLQWILRVYIEKASPSIEGLDRYWPTRTEELIINLGLGDNDAKFGNT